MGRESQYECLNTKMFYNITGGRETRNFYSAFYL